MPPPSPSDPKEPLRGSGLTPAAITHPAPRPDVEGTRRRILDVAGSLFASHGITAGYADIARAAGLGVGTVYRHFPERDDLVEAIFERQMQQTARDAAAAAAHPDAWRGLCDFLAHSIELQAANRGFAHVLAMGHDGTRISRARNRLAPSISSLLGRAKESGMLRPEINEVDLGIITGMVSRVGSRDQTELRHRYLDILLDGLVVHREHIRPLPLNEPIEADLHSSFQEVHRNPGGRPTHG